MQTTLRQKVTFTGFGLHSGGASRVTLCPAPANHGIVFRRSDVIGRNPLVPARWDRVGQFPLNTRIGNADGVHVSTIEHLMAALAGCGVHNALIEIDGAEVPILDGSAAQFVRGIVATGLLVMPVALQVVEVLRGVEVRQGDALARLDPAAGLTIDFTIDFADSAIGHQALMLDMGNGAFVRELCDSRTFCRQADVDAMHARGLALGGSLHNAVVVDGAAVLSPGGLRHRDEAVRHKMLDALGDLATAGAPILGHYTGVRAGHALTNHLLRTLFASPDNYRMVDCMPAQAMRLPGAGLRPQDLAHVA